VEEFKRKCVGIAPGESFTVADLEGPGVINRFYFHYNVRWPRSLSRGLELRFYWDGEEEPSVCAPLGDFFGSPFCKYVEYEAFAQSMLNGGYVSRFPMPFRKRARLVIRNASPYQAEPHVPFDLPPFEDRLPSSWLAHGLRSLALFPMVLATKWLCRRIAA